MGGGWGDGDELTQRSLATHIEGILPKGPYLPCLRMAGRALLAGYHRYVGVWNRVIIGSCNKLSPVWRQNFTPINPVISSVGQDTMFFIQ